MTAALKYEGTPCKCGSTLRYQSTGRCVDCIRKACRRYKQTKKGNLAVQVSCQRYRRTSKYRTTTQQYNQAYGLTEHGKPARRVGAQRHRAKYLNVEGSYTTKEWLELKQLYGCCCLCCGRHESKLKTPLEQNHVIPLSKGGTNWITNIQPLCEDCNGMGGKGTKIIDYREKYGRY
jgi:5-methylcytosine-specific restriction endonuclease McrA